MLNAVERRIRAADVAPGDYVVSIVGRPEPINAIVLDVTAPDAGMRLTGPRGGAYRVTAAGAGTLIRIVTPNATPVVAKTATVVVMREAE